MRYGMPDTVDSDKKFKPLYQGDSIAVYGGEQGYQKQTNESFRHTWELRNTGLVTWEHRKLVFIKTYKVGPLAEETEIEIPKVVPGTNKKIAVVMQTRGKEGRFDCHFEMHDADGRNCFPNHKSIFDIKVKVDFVPKETTEVQNVADNIEKWTNLKDVQEYLGVGRKTILQWISKRDMPAYKVGRMWKFKLSEVDDWIRSGGASDDNTTKKTEKLFIPKHQYQMYLGE